MNKKIISALTGVLAATGLALAVSAPAQAMPGMPDDETFHYLLNNDGLEFAFGLEKYQAQRYCDSLMAGVSGANATYDLMRSGGYPFDVANAIASAGATAYCSCTSIAQMVQEGLPLVMPNACSEYETTRRSY